MFSMSTKNALNSMFLLTVMIFLNEHVLSIFIAAFLLYLIVPSDGTFSPNSLDHLPIHSSVFYLLTEISYYLYL